MKIRLSAPLASVAVALLLQAGAAQQASAQNYYVSTTGSDSSGSGSQSSPWATIAHASTKAGPGSTVHVAAGVYKGDFDTSSSGTSSAYIVYEGDTANFGGAVNCAQIAANHGDLTQCPRLVGDTGNSGTWNNSGNYVEIKGFDVTGPASNFYNGIYTDGNATIITENHVHDILGGSCSSNGGSGINLNGTNAEVTDNYVHNIGPYPSACGFIHGIYFLKAGGYAENNISFNNSGWGIQLWHEPSNIDLVNNTLFNNASGGIVLGTDDSNFTVDYITVSNNIVVNNGGAGISEQGCCSSSTGMHNVYTHNLVSGNSNGAYSLQNGLTATSTVTSSAGFVNDSGTKSGDYHLQSSSGAIGMATSNNAPSRDFDNNPRPYGGSYDAGAYEYVSATTAALSVSPDSAGFSGTTVGSTSPAQTLTLKNQSSSAVSLSGMSIAGSNSSSFAQSSNCGSSVAANGSCSIDVTFTPSASGALSATLNITPSSGSALQVGLSGDGDSAAGTVSLSPAPLSFPSTAVGSTSAIEYSTLTNTGSSTLTLNEPFSISGPFAFGNLGTCAATLAPGASCTISVVFMPTASGSASGAATVTDSAGTQTLPLSGTGAGAAAVSLSPGSLSFPSTKVGGSSSVIYATLTNTGASALSLQEPLAISGPFAFANAGTCGTSVAPMASCTISVVFDPTYRGTATGAVTLTDSAGTQTLSLSGRGH